MLKKNLLNFDSVQEEELLEDKTDELKELMTQVANFDSQAHSHLQSENKGAFDPRKSVNKIIHDVINGKYTVEINLLKEALEFVYSDWTSASGLDNSRIFSKVICSAATCGIEYRDILQKLPSFNKIQKEVFQYILSKECNEKIQIEEQYDVAWVFNKGAIPVPYSLRYESYRHFNYYFCQQIAGYLYSGNEYAIKYYIENKIIDLSIFDYKIFGCLKDINKDRVIKILLENVNEEKYETIENMLYKPWAFKFLNYMVFNKIQGYEHSLSFDTNLFIAHMSGYHLGLLKTNYFPQLYEYALNNLKDVDPEIKYKILRSVIECRDELYIKMVIQFCSGLDLSSYFSSNDNRILKVISAYYKYKDYCIQYNIKFDDSFISKFLSRVCDAYNKEANSKNLKKNKNNKDVYMEQSLLALSKLYCKGFPENIRVSRVPSYYAKVLNDAFKNNELPFVKNALIKLSSSIIIFTNIFYSDIISNRRVFYAQEYKWKNSCYHLKSLINTLYQEIKINCDKFSESQKFNFIKVILSKFNSCSYLNGPKFLNEFLNDTKLFTNKEKIFLQEIMIHMFRVSYGDFLFALSDKSDSDSSNAFKLLNNASRFFDIFPLELFLEIVEWLGAPMPMYRQHLFYYYNNLNVNKDSHTSHLYLYGSYPKSNIKTKGDELRRKDESLNEDKNIELYNEIMKKYLDFPSIKKYSSNK